MCQISAAFFQAKVTFLKSSLTLWAEVIALRSRPAQHFAADLYYSAATRGGDNLLICLCSRTVGSWRAETDYSSDPFIFFPHQACPRPLLTRESSELLWVSFETVMGWLSKTLQGHHHRLHPGTAALPRGCEPQKLPHDTCPVAWLWGCAVGTRCLELSHAEELRHGACWDTRVTCDKARPRRGDQWAKGQWFKPQALLVWLHHRGGRVVARGQVSGYAARLEMLRAGEGAFSVSSA